MSCPISDKSRNRWFLDVLYHRAWYFLDWYRCVPGQGRHVGTAVLLRSQKESHCDLKLHHFGLHRGVCVCTFSSIWQFLCLYEHVFARGPNIGSAFIVIEQHDGRALLIWIQRRREWTLSKRRMPMSLEKYQRDGARRNWKAIKVKFTDPRWMTDLIIIFTILPHSDGVVKGEGFLVRRLIPSFVASDEFSHCLVVLEIIWTWPVLGSGLGCIQYFL